MLMCLNAHGDDYYNRVFEAASRRTEIAAEPHYITTYHRTGILACFSTANSENHSLSHPMKYFIPAWHYYLAAARTRHN